MKLSGETLTLLPALLLFGLAAYLGFLAVKAEFDLEISRELSICSVVIFHIGTVLAICWLVYWALYRKVAKKE